jgi:hypothetical protein
MGRRVRAEHPGVEPGCRHADQPLTNRGNAHHNNKSSKVKFSQCYLPGGANNDSESRKSTRFWNRIIVGLELFAPPPTHTTIAHELLAHWQPMKPESIIIMISEPGRAGKKKNCPSRILKQSVFVPAAGRVCWLFIFKDTEPSPLQDSSSVRQQGCLPGPPPVVPHPESIVTVSSNPTSKFAKA